MMVNLTRNSPGVAVAVAYGAPFGVALAKLATRLPGVILDTRRPSSSIVMALCRRRHEAKPRASKYARIERPVAIWLLMPRARV